MHQHQREVQTTEIDGEVLRYIEVTPRDIACANRLAHEVLGRCLDELPPQTRRVLGVICEQVASEAKVQGIDRSAVRLTRRQVREATGISDTQVRIHLERLVQLDHLLPHVGRRGQSFVYELIFDGDAKADTPHLMGLIEPESLTLSLIHI